MLLEAQFYIQERDRRHDSRIGLRDLILELVIIALIGWEVHEGNKQFDLLKKMNDNTAATTAATGQLRQAQLDSLATLKDSLQAMNEVNKSVQDELDVNYQLDPEIVFDRTSRIVNIGNNGRTKLLLWGGRVGNAPISTALENEPRIVTPGGHYHILDDPIFDQLEKTPRGTSSKSAFEIFLANAVGRKFISRGYVIAVWQGDALQINTQTVSIRQENWSALTK
jgi:hypothetical protein